jgi:hypothetical protein
LLRKICLSIFFCNRFHRLDLPVRPPAHRLKRSIHNFISGRLLLSLTRSSKIRHEPDTDYFWYK